jgi:hypothetical protein
MAKSRRHKIGKIYGTAGECEDVEHIDAGEMEEADGDD